MVKPLDFFPFYLINNYLISKIQTGLFFILMLLVIYNFSDRIYVEFP